MKTVAAVLLSFFILSHAFADETPADQWSKMSPEKKEEIRNNYRTYQKMTPDEKQSLDQKYEKYKALPPAEKARLQKNYEAFKKLPPERQARILKAAEKYKENKSTSKGKHGKHKKPKQ
jgi:hypothetical protein